MEPFSKHRGLVATLDRVNVDTDQIIPAQFLKRIERSGFGQFCFYDWRFKDGAPNPDFELNQPRFSGATILVTGANFGCGSSREHAPWALLDYGFRSIIAPSFADIFYNNCLKNGLLPIVLSTHQVDRLFHETAAFPGFRLTIDLEQQTVATADGATVFGFEIEPFRKHCLLNGLDEIGLTLAHADEIHAFEAKHKAEQPWLF